MGITSEQAAHLFRNTGAQVPRELEGAEEIQKRLHKFNAKRKAVGDIEFHSSTEATAYQILKSWESAGAITDLRLQPVFTLQERFRDSDGKTVPGIRYTADFQFFDVLENRTRYIDVKGFETPAFKRAMRLMKNRYPAVTIELWDRKRVKEMSR